MKPARRHLEWSTIKLANGEEVKAATTQRGLRVPLMFDDEGENNLTKVLSYIKEAFDDDDTSGLGEMPAVSPSAEMPDRRVEWNEKTSRFVVRWTDEKKKRRSDSKHFTVVALAEDGAPKGMAEYSIDMGVMRKRAREFWDTKDQTNGLGSIRRGWKCPRTWRQLRY